MLVKKIILAVLLAASVYAQDPTVSLPPSLPVTTRSRPSSLGNVSTGRQYEEVQQY